MVITPPAQNKIFISYSHKDAKYADRLKKYLAFLSNKQLGQLDFWSDTNIKPGSNWQEEIHNAIANAKVVILLISADYLATDFIVEDELPPLLVPAEREGTTIVPVILRPCAFQMTELAQFQAFNTPSKPLSSLSRYEQDLVWENLAEFVEKASTTTDKSLPISSPVKSTILTYSEHTREVRSIAWSPNGHYIASGGDDRTVQVWEADSGKQILTHRGHSDWVLGIAWSPDGRYIASGGIDQTVQVWGANSGKKLFTYIGHPGEVRSIAWSPDSQNIASGGDDRTVQVWDASTGRKLITCASKDKVLDVAWSPNGKLIAFASNDGTVSVCEAATGIEIFVYQGHSNRVNAVIWSPNSERIASASNDTTVQLWRSE